MPKILSSEIISLVHHVKLNESGWLEKAVQNIIISVFGINDNTPQNEIGLLMNLQNELGDDFDKVRVSRQFEILKNKQIIIALPFDKSLFILSDEVYKDFKDSFEGQKEIEHRASKRFFELCEQICPDYTPKSLWKELNEQLIIPLIREIGAKTYELLSGEESISIEDYGQFNNFTSKFKEDKGKLQVLLLSYFDFKNEYVKKYVLHQLNAYFFIEATNLNQNTVDQVYSLSKSQTNLKIFVDTNFLLTLLDLHDNPSNDASLSLLELLKEIKNRVNVKFYVLPVTVFEFQNLISKFKDYLKKIKPTLNQAIAAENINEFSGIIKKYFQKCHEKNTMLDIDDYFDPYLENFTVNIRKKGVEIQQDNMDKYSTDQRVVDDLLEQVEYRIERNLNSGKYQGLTNEEIEFRKNNIYDKFNHDCQLWYYVKDKRPSYIDSPKDIVTWILTLDFSFLEFDKFKQLKDKNNKISLCLHPNEFISMLQFWVPRTEKFENAILGNFRLPFLFKEIDGESEKISLDILRAMSQYEDSEKFSTELVTEMLTNKALRQKIKVSNTVEENASLIKDELFEKYETTKLDLDKEKVNNENLSVELNIVRKELGTLSKKIDELQQKTNSKIEKEFELIRKSQIEDLKNKKDKLVLKKEQSEIRLKDYQQLVEKAEAEIEKEKQTLSFNLLSIFFGREKKENELRIQISSKFFDSEKIKQLEQEILEIDNELKYLEIPTHEDKIIIYCENQNAKLFNKLNFKNLHFYPEKDSNGVFIKTTTYTTHFGLRDRDFLTDGEIIKLKAKHKNYLILEYYCFENYLYHPENLADLLGDAFDKKWFIDELIRQKNSKYDKILLKLANARSGYQEFKNPDIKIRENDEIICDYLKSNHVETFLKSFSLKTEFDKSIIEKLQLSQDTLAQTDWFRAKIEKVLSFESS